MRENFRCFISPTDLQKETLCYSDAMGFDSNPEFYINRKSFNDYLVMYTMYGKLWCIQNGQKIAVTQGEAVFLDLHQPHEYYFDKSVETQIAWAAFNGFPAVSLVQKLLTNTALPFKFKTPDLYPCILSLFEVSDCPEPDIFLQSEYCYALLLKVFRESCRKLAPKRPNADQDNFKKAIWHVISHNLHREVTIDELAGSVSLSKYHFIRTFHAAFGASPMQFITQEKIRQAKYQLENTTGTILNISQSLGFDNPGYFSKVFKRVTGVSPSDYRKCGRL